MKHVARFTEIFFYVKDLFADHVKQAAAFGGVFLFGAILGGKNGVRTAATGVFDSGSLSGLYIGGKINIFTFVLLSLLSAAAVYALICALSCNRVTYWLTLVIFFAYPFGIASRAVVFVSAFKLAALPYVIVCFVPLRLCFLCCLLLAWLITAPKPCGRSPGFSAPQILSGARLAAPAGIAAGGLIVAEGVLTFVLTFGIAL